MRRLLSAALLLTACTSSHTGGDAGARACDEAPPVCHPSATGVAPGCCREATSAPSCVDDLWRCPAGSLEEGACVGFLERGECEGVPDAGIGDWGACGVPSDCVLRANSCCGQCGIPTLEGMDAVHESRTAEHFAEVCPVPEPCPDCPSGTNPELIATCAAARCAAIDLGREALTECNTDLDCAIRVPDCCPCGADTSPWRLIAIRADQASALEALVCDPGTGCPECEPIYPDDVSAVCGADGHCEVSIGPPGG